MTPQYLSVEVMGVGRLLGLAQLRYSGIRSDVSVVAMVTQVVVLAVHNKDNKSNTTITLVIIVTLP